MSLRRCNQCLTIFEPGVADPAADGEPRCPQCFLSDSTPVAVVEDGEEVITKRSKFR